MIDDAVEEGGKGTSVAEGAGVDGVEHFSEGRVEIVLLVEVGVAEVVNVFCEVAEEENVVLTDFAGNFDLTKLVKRHRMHSRLRYLHSHRRRFR